MDYTSSNGKQRSAFYESILFPETICKICNTHIPPKHILQTKMLDFIGQELCRRINIMLTNQMTLLRSQICIFLQFHTVEKNTLQTCIVVTTTAYILSKHAGQHANIMTCSRWVDNTYVDVCKERLTLRSPP